MFNNDVSISIHYIRQELKSKAPRKPYLLSTIIPWTEELPFLAVWFMASQVFDISPGGRGCVIERIRKGRCENRKYGKKPALAGWKRRWGIALNDADGHKAAQRSDRFRYSSITACTAFRKEAGTPRYLRTRLSSSGFSLCSDTGSILCGISVYPIR